MMAQASPDFPTRRTLDTVIPPEPLVWVVIVVVAGQGAPEELEYVKLLNVHAVEPEVVPKFLSAATLCSNVPPVRLIIPAVPATLPFTVIFWVPLMVPAVIVKSLAIATAASGWTVAAPFTITLYSVWPLGEYVEVPVVGAKVNVELPSSTVKVPVPFTNFVCPVTDMLAVWKLAT